MTCTFHHFLFFQKTGSSHSQLDLFEKSIKLDTIET